MNPMQIMQMVNQLKSNPMQFFGQMGVPQSAMNDPNAIIQHLMNNGKVTQEQYNKAMQMAKNMGFKGLF